MSAEACLFTVLIASSAAFALGYMNGRLREIDRSTEENDESEPGSTLKEGM